VLPLTLLFGVAAMLAGGMRLLLLWSSTRLSFATGADLSFNIYRRTLYQPYAIHVARNSSEVINGITSKVQSVISSTINPVVTMTASTIMLMLILTALLAVNPLIALAAFAGFGLIYVVIISVTRKRLAENGSRIAQNSTQLIKSIQEGLGGIRDVLIDGSQATYCEIYRTADLKLRRAQGNNQFIGSSPRYVMEAMGMVLIAALAFTLSQQSDGISKAIPILGALALGAQRLLPILQQLYQGWSDLRGNQSSLIDILSLLDQPLPSDVDKSLKAAMPYQRSISLNQVSFRYAPEAPWVLQNLSLTILKGKRIGFIGTTGSGKSTLSDILMGLLSPTTGMLQIDGETITAENNRAWQMHIAHVPQAIFLADASIEENIAFGVPKAQIDTNLVRQAARQAQIADVIEGWELQYQTMVGERGVRLSGGQRQRIGIARALYKQADVLIFDEATSALDNETEQAVMQAIENLGGDLTIIIIAHRITTLKNCDQIIELSEGDIKKMGSYQDFFGIKDA
jgi:ATP-binding cassette subfamily B protein